MEEQSTIIFKARESLEQGRAEETLEMLHDSKLNDNSEALFLKGEASYHLQKWGEAMNYFRDYQSGNPEDQRAQVYIDMIQSILSFYHTDQFNP
jgi:hypothetical protein